MFFRRDKAKAQLEAISRSHAVIEFDLEGRILSANNQFLSAMGYTLDEIRGKHHQIFIDPAYARSSQYAEFWKSLARGEYQAGQFKRLAKNGQEVWIEASYNPIFGGRGKPTSVVKYATDITKQKLLDADYEGQITAISKSQAVIHFNMDGTIITANENFLNAMGYKIEEIRGKHHRMFADSAYAKSTQYKEFWEKLNRGEFVAGQFKRLGKDGKEVWIEASYNPILDMSGKPFKVVKYAVDITKQKLQNADVEGQLAAISKSQAIIHFNLDV